MGNCWTTSTAVKDLDPVEEHLEDHVIVEAETEKAPAEVFALMRGGHDVIRGNMTTIDQLIEKKDWEAAFESYSKLAKWEEMHSMMKDGYGDENTPKGVFAIMDETFGGIAQEFELREGYAAIGDLEKKADEFIDVSDGESFEEVFLELKTASNAQMRKEEKIIEPKYKHMKMSGDFDLTELMMTEILALIVESPDFKFYVQHAVSVLEKHHGNQPRAETFAHALCECATPEQWETWSAWIKEAASQKMYDNIVKLTGS
mmetsp:Transcript_12150/g.18363  ORF Transcript_12150/g.18363 Transcript_12150/m.18363 type:complete len:259 (+) Transcript_12150:89-865(+)